MKAVLIQLSLSIVFVQIASEHLNTNNNNVIVNDTNSELTNKTEPYQKCVLNEIIKKIEAILMKQIKESESQIKSLKPEINIFHNRKVRSTDDPIEWNKCATRMEFEHHRNLETEHINAIKKELERLQELVRLLRDQQSVLNMLGDFEKPKPKIDDDDDQRQLMELFKMLKNNIPAQPKNENGFPTSPNSNHEDFQKLMTEISKLQKQVQNRNMDHETKLKTELINQKNHLQALENEMEGLRNGQALFVNLNSSKPDANSNPPDIVGAKTPPHALTSHSKTFNRKQGELKPENKNHDKLANRPLVHVANPKERAGNDDFLDNLQKILLDSPEQTPEVKENPLAPNSDLETRLDDLEKQLKLSQKMKQLEKKIKQIHESNAESKIIDDEDDDLRSQIKKMQRQLNNLNKNKAESKSLDEEDILDELKNLQGAINDLKPKEDTSQSKIGGADIQVMLNKLIGVPVRPVVPTPTHSQLTPAQIQVLRKIMALKAGSTQHHVPASHAHPESGYPYSNILYPPYASYGQPSSNPYGSFYGNLQQPSGYSYGIGPYPGYESSSYGHSGYGSNQHGPYDFPHSYGYSSSPYSTADFGGNLGHYGNGAGGISHAHTKYGPHSNPGHYVFGPQYSAIAPGNYYNPSPYEYQAPIPYAENQQHAPKPTHQGGKINAGTQYHASPSYTSNGKPGNYEESSIPQTGYEGQQFFRGYQDDESTDYQSDSPQSYSHPQENTYAGNSYAQQKMGDLQTQIYKLQNVINHLNSPEYVQKPDDQKTIYELDHKISDLKGIVNNLAQDTDQPHYDMNYPGPGGPNYRTSSEANSKLRRSRFRRDIKNSNNSTNESAIDDFFQQLSDVVTVINYLSEHISDTYSNKTVKDTPSNIIKMIKKRMAPKANEEPMTNLYKQLNALMKFVDTLSNKMAKYESCTDEENCANSKNHVRNKRDTEDSDEADNALQKIWDAVNLIVEHTEDDADRVTNTIKKEAEKPPLDIHNQRAHLQKQLDHLKQQLDGKLRANTHLGQKTSNPQSRSSYYQPANYYQPPHYPQPYYPQPIYYQTYYDYEDKDKKDKFKILKVKKDLKKETKFDKIFSKILEKILDKVIKAIPIIIRKLLGLEFDFFGEKDDGYGYNSGYGVEKKKKFGIFSFIPMLIFKIISNISFFVKKLKKNKFIKTFLVPGFVTITTAGLVVFLVWWLSGDEETNYSDYNNYGGYGNYDNYGYGGNIGYNRNSINDNGYEDDEYSSARSRNNQNYAKPPRYDYSSSNTNQNPNFYNNPYLNFYNKNPLNYNEASIPRPNFKPVRYF